ncbi:alcohol oxidase-like protein [Schizophyllum commune H4-8]|uniref:alcohol oxidase-like protein n=1 Tax=Schizophyllum commune (strain H4-8 / FGSC 9210) TaxID=578458 RepID=UPI002160D41D|nr:alcohol oxidase-like protein [Schizophyllum commune H4-8]KAI5886016.1 alcohol oxidase-like protein [Schizophyllum commune H4-8]
MSVRKEYDIIFAGAGTAACVAAGRLAAADPSLRILLLEAGPHTLGLAAHVEPYRFVTHLAPESATVTPYVSSPSAALANRSIVVPVGHCVGGGSSVNFMMYTRAAASDYDDWGAPGWTTKELLPLLKKSETYQEDSPRQDTHGYDGLLKVSYGGHFLHFAREFLDVAAAYDKEREITADMNTLFECDKYARWPKWIDKESGRRSDPAHHYIYNQAANTNLRLIAGARVVRVLFKDKKACGVEYVSENQPGSGISTVYAAKLVVLSAGAFGTPAILERSGIGGAQLLEKLAIPVVVDLPGVGESYQDHHLMHVRYHADDDMETLDALLDGEPEEIAYWSKMYEEEGKGLKATNGIDAGIKIRPTATERASMGPAFAAYWDEVFESAPDKPLLAISCSAVSIGATPSVDHKSRFLAISFYTVLLYPQSRGRTHITSATDAFAPPAFESGFLEDSGADLAALVWGYKHSRELARRMPVYRGELAMAHPIFPGCGAAVSSRANVDTTTATDDATVASEGPTVGISSMPLVKLEYESEAKEPPTASAQQGNRDIQQERHTETKKDFTSPLAGPAPGPVPIDAPNIVYSAEDDKAIEDWAREHVQTTWHSLGTCPMRPRSEGGVVDARLNVYGVQGLKIVDLSIAPFNVGANTCSTALVIGEKAAMLIAEDLGMKGA